MARISGRRIAVLATDGVEEVELTEPAQALRQAGATVSIVSLEAGQFQAMQQDVNPAGKIDVDLTVAEATADQFDGLLLPGGTTNPDKLRMDERAVGFVRGFVTGRQADRGDLPRLLDADQRRWREGTQDDLVAVAAGRPAERRRHLGGRALRARRHAGDLAQSPRPAGVLRGDRRAVQLRLPISAAPASATAAPSAGRPSGS